MDTLQTAEHILIQEIFNDSSLKSLVNLSAKILENPVAFYLLSYTDVVYSDNYPKDAIEDYMNCRTKSTTEEKIEWTKIFYASLEKHTPNIQSWPYMRSRQLVCGSYVGGTLVGYITMPEINEGLIHIDHKLIELVTRVYGMALLIKENANLKSSDHSLLWGLLADKINPLYLERNLIDPVFGNLSSYRMLWFLKKQSNGILITNRDIDEMLSCFTYQVMVSFEEGYALLVDGNDLSNLSNLSKLATLKNIAIGASDPFDNIKDIKHHFANAQCTLRYSSQLKKSTGLYQFDQYKLHHLIALSSNHQTLSDFVSNKIYEIEAYDKKNHSDYLLTLKTYLEYNKNIDETSKALFVHKNTVFYRVKKLEEFFDINLSDCSQVALLVSSLIIYDHLL